jgi:hypothetical protein
MPFAGAMALPDDGRAIGMDGDPRRAFESAGVEFIDTAEAP